MKEYIEIVKRWISAGFTRADMVLLVVALTHPEILTAVNTVYDESAKHSRM